MIQDHLCLSTQKNLSPPGGGGRFLKIWKTEIMKFISPLYDQIMIFVLKNVRNSEIKTLKADLLEGGGGDDFSTNKCPWCIVFVFAVPVYSGFVLQSKITHLSAVFRKVM